MSPRRPRWAGPFGAAFAPILVLLLCPRAEALITNNLAADWQAGVGITASGGLVSQWNDQHLVLNNDGLGPFNLTQSTPTNAPYSVTDARGFPGVLFTWAYFSPLPQIFLNIPNALGGFDTENTTVYVVATGPLEPQNDTLIWFGGTTSGWLKWYQLTNLPSCLMVGPLASTLYPPLNPAVFVAESDTNQTTIRWNNSIQTNAPQTRLITTGGGRIGAYTNSEFYSGIIYRVMVYKAAHSVAQQNAQVAELAALYGVLTNYTKQVICRGASTSSGAGSTLLQTYPFQLWERYPEIEWHNQGLGFQIGTNGEAATLYALDSGMVDTLYNGLLQKNWLFVLAGINDINTDHVSGHATWQRLTNYVVARKSAQPWTVIVSTIQSDVLEPLTNGDYNACIRTNGGPWDGLVDPGLNSPTETRLDNPTNTTYFISDGVHLTNLGYKVIADHFGQIVNVPRRTTGAFWP